jgi:spore germination protein GerM
MRAFRGVALVLVVVAVAAGTWWYLNRRNAAAPAAVTVYYTRLDGTTLVPWRVSLGPARDRRSVLFYAAVQAVAGPPAGTDAVRFPAGTRVVSAQLDGSTAVVDLSDAVNRSAEGGFTEAGEFKALVYTLTGLPSVTSVRVTVGGESVATLPGGHFELDEPLTRQSF